MVLDWGEGAFTRTAPLSRHPETGEEILTSEIAAVIRAAYDPDMPEVARDPSHALRLAARIG
jgi:hypothetical protein